MNSLSRTGEKKQKKTTTLNRGTLSLITGLRSGQATVSEGQHGQVRKSYFFQSKTLSETAGRQRGTGVVRTFTKYYCLSFEGLLSIVPNFLLLF